MARSKITAEEFVRKWQAAENLDEFLAATGMTEVQAKTRSYNYRAKWDIPLKKMPRRIRARSKTDWAKIRNLAEKLLNNKE